MISPPEENVIAFFHASFDRFKHFLRFVSVIKPFENRSFLLYNEFGAKKFTISTL